MKFGKKILNSVKEDLNKSAKNTNKSKINQKSIKWIVLCFPYGLYYMFKHKTFKLPIRIFITVLIAIIVIGVVDFVVYPDRVLDNMVKKSITEYVNNHKEMGEFEYLEPLKRNDTNLKEYYLFTTNDKYIILVNKDKKKSEITSIYEVGHKQKKVYESNDFKLPVDLNPAVALFIKDNGYGKVEKVVNTKYPFQTVKTDKGEYVFYCDFGRVDKVYQIKNNKTEVIYKIKNDEIILPEFKKILDKGKYGNLEEILAYDLESDGQIEYFKTDKGYFKFKKFFNGQIIIYQH